MIALKIWITKYLDSSQFGWVECKFEDAYNATWTINEKLPVVSSLELNEDSKYPQLGFIDCRVTGKRIEQNTELMVIDLSQPWDVESISA